MTPYHRKLPEQMPAMLSTQDPLIYRAIQNELYRQYYQIELIASENIVSPAILEAQGSVLTNKYAEGYPEKRYYGGCQYVDEVERLAIQRACQLFQCEFANVQAHSGSQANQAAFLALLQPGDTILSLSLDAGGHLSHGSPVNLAGKWFHVVSYGLQPSAHRLDMEAVARLAHQHRPRLIIAGASAYPRRLDFAAFRAIADEVGAYLMADIAHIAGLVAVGAHPHPFPHAHVVTSTTHKTLRGPRGGLILCQDGALARKLNAAIFPGLQGGPLMHVIAAKAICFYEALQPSFATYIEAVVHNAQVLASHLEKAGLQLVTGGTDNHLLLVDLRSVSLSGLQAEICLEAVGLTCNKNSIPDDPLPPRETSGIRLGTAATTSRGFPPEAFVQIAQWIAHILHHPTEAHPTIATAVKALCAAYPLPYGPCPQ